MTLYFCDRCGKQITMKAHATNYTVSRTFSGMKGEAFYERHLHFCKKCQKIIDDMLDVTLFHFDQVTGDKEFEEAPYNFNYDEEF